MAHVTAIVSVAQVEYRVAEGHGCGSRQEELEQQSEYRVAGMGGLQMWVGEGLAEVGLMPGRVWAEGAQTADAGAARALMAGVHPGTGEQLVAPVLRLPEEAKLPAVALLDAVVGRGVEAGARQTLAGERDWARLVEGARRLGDGYTVDVRLLAKVASRAGVDLDVVYGQDRVDAALGVAAGERVDVRTKGYDLTLTLPKSFSVAWALAPAGQRQAIADAYTQAAVDVVKTAEGWHARATRGHHGGGKSAEIVQTSGLLGWLSVDPVNRNGDAHWHAHVTLAAMGKAADGGWSALASAGTDSVFSSVGALGGLMEARARAITAERFGWQYRESLVTGRLEVAHVPDAAIRATSTRRADVVQAMLDAGLDPATVTREQDDAAGQAARKAKAPGLAHAGNVVERTRAQVTAEGVDPALPRPVTAPALVELRPGEAGGRTVDGLAAGSWEAAVGDARALLLDPEQGPTAHAPSFSWRQALALVAATVHGGADQAQYEVLLAAALDTPGVVRLPERPGRSPAFTTAAVLAAEKTVLAAAAGSRHGGAATVTETQLATAIDRFTQQNGYGPNDEQLAAVHRILLGGGRLDVLTGLPGTGKTTVMRIVGDAYTEAGRTVRGLATAAIAAEGLAAQAGFEARTVAAELIMGGTVHLVDADVYVVDEAGMVDTRDMAQLLERAQAHGAKVIAVGDDRQLPAIGIGGWFAPARELTDGSTLVDVRRQQAEHELAALRAYRAGAESQALAGYAAAGQILVTDTRDQALAAAAAVWHERAREHPDPLDRVTNVALMAGRREDTQTLNALARARTRQTSGAPAQETTYRLMGGGELRLAVGDAVVLRRNEGVGPLALRNGRRAVVEHIGTDRAVTLAWRDTTGGERRQVTLTPGDVVAGQVATSYLEADHVQGASAGTVHLSQGRTVDHAVAVIDPHAHAATYVALSRDRQSTTLVLSAEAVAETPEELARLRALPGPERDAAVITRYAARLHEAGAVEADRHRLLDEQWPELAAPSQRQATAPEAASVGAGRGVARGRREPVPVGAGAEVASTAPAVRTGRGTEQEPPPTIGGRGTVEEGAVPPEEVTTVLEADRAATVEVDAGLPASGTERRGEPLTRGPDVASRGEGAGGGGQTVSGTTGRGLAAAPAEVRTGAETASPPAAAPVAGEAAAAGRATSVSLCQLAALAAQARDGAASSAALAQRVHDAAAGRASEAERSSATAPPPQRSTGLERVADEPSRDEERGHER